MNKYKHQIRLAAVSISSGSHIEKNLNQAITALEEASHMGADWVLLPEMFSYIGPYDQLPMIADEPRGKLYEQLAAQAQKHKICLFAGSYAERVPPASDTSKVLNVSYVFGRNGEELGRYEKTHLFQLLENGRKKYSEPDGFHRGSELKSILVDGWHVGLTICYDIRFPELYAALAEKAPLDMITLPSAFTLETGKDHWEVLLRARAIEQQCYVFAANQFGSPGVSKRNYGHSMIIDPWGCKLADTGQGYGIAMAVANKERIQDVRAKIPIQTDKRSDLYISNRVKKV